MPWINKPLVIEQRIRDMMQYGHIALRQFPKSEKHVLAAEIRTSMLTLLRLVITAAKRYHKKTTLTDPDVELAVLQNQIRLAKRPDLSTHQQISALERSQSRDRQDDRRLRCSLV